MVSTTDIIDRLKIFKAQSASKYKIKFMGLFGSYARQQQDEKSDVDVFILCVYRPLMRHMTITTIHSDGINLS